ncbi:MAG: hypothetical protein HYY13_03040 [Nitrospirae bacterium]|nr:hypothetical protein [Nitrospirota bacterium]
MGNRAWGVALLAVLAVRASPIPAYALTIDTRDLKAVGGDPQGEFKTLTLDLAEAMLWPPTGEPESLGRQWLIEGGTSLKRLNPDRPAWAETSGGRDNVPSWLTVPRLSGAIGLPYRFDATAGLGLVAGYPASQLALKHLLIEGTPLAPGLSASATWSALWGNSTLYVSVSSLRSWLAWRFLGGHFSLGVEQDLVYGTDRRDGGLTSVKDPQFQAFAGYQTGVNLWPGRRLGLKAFASLSRIPFLFSAGHPRLGQIYGGLFWRF